MSPVRVITALNVNYALVAGIWHLKTAGERSDSRNGPVIRAPSPVVTTYILPWQRLCFTPVRDANHVFHLMETIWMFAGRQDVKWLLQFNSNFSDYAEADGNQWGAYGHRWRTWFGFDQLTHVANELMVPNNRRVVLQMWDAHNDLGAMVRDVPCNTHVYFEVQQTQKSGTKRLDMTVCCRSNDMIWGAYGANAVHFSMLQQLIAETIGVEVGAYHQFSNNFHLYTEMGPGGKLLKDFASEPDDRYREHGWPKMRLLTGNETLSSFLWECEQFVGDDEFVPKNTFLRDVAMNLRAAYRGRKMGLTGWETFVNLMPDCDWRTAFMEWVERRAK